jgi:osmotically inducible protein OsmC
MIRSAVATWNGSPVIGEGLVTTSSGIMSNALYASAGSSTGNDPCTSPSEILAAAIASLVSLMLAREIVKEGLKPEHVKTEAVLTLEQSKTNWAIVKVDLHVTASLPEMDEHKFQKACKNAKARCAVTRALNVPITITSKREAIHPVAA